MQEFEAAFIREIRGSLLCGGDVGVLCHLREAVVHTLVPEAFVGLVHIPTLLSCPTQGRLFRKVAPPMMRRVASFISSEFFASSRPLRELGISPPISPRAVLVLRNRLRPLCLFAINYLLRCDLAAVHIWTPMIRSRFGRMQSQYNRYRLYQGHVG